MDTYHVDCWTSLNPGKGGWQTLKNGKVQDWKNYEDTHSNNYYELAAIHAACFRASLEPNASEIFSDSQIAIGWIHKDPKPTVMNRDELMVIIHLIRDILRTNKQITVKRWLTRKYGENPADFGRKKRSRNQWVFRGQ